MSSNPPTDHHYIPRFYLRRWHSALTGKLTEHSRPRGTLVTKDVTAKATAFSDHLYAIRGHEAATAQQFEQDYFAKIDGLAADALEHLECYGGEANWSARSRSAWSRFIIGLLMRTPEDVQKLREMWPQYLGKTDPATEERYRLNATDADPDSFAAFIKSQPQGFFERSQFQILGKLIDHHHVGSRINNMTWKVVEIPDDAPSLLTSDRPVVMTKFINHPSSHIALPIGPRKLFVAARNKQLLHNIHIQKRRKELARSMNRAVAGQAVRYVYATDRNQEAFIAKHFGTKPQARLLDLLLGNVTA